MFSSDTKVFLYGKHLDVAQRMIDFDYICGKSEPSLVGIVSEGQSGSVKLFRGSVERIFPLFSSIDETETTGASTMVNFASFRSAFQTTRDAMSKSWIDTIAIVAEGIPERDTRKLKAYAVQLQSQGRNINLIGPSTVGGIAAGALRIGHSGGSLENIIKSKLYRPGSVGLLSKSGGMMNELCRVIANNSDGVHTGIAFGGDRFPLLDIEKWLLDFEHNKKITMIVILDEVGNDDAMVVCDLVREKKIRKPVVMWVSGSFAEHTTQEVQFGHAGAKAHKGKEKTYEKLKMLRDAGIHVPTSYENMGKEIHNIRLSVVPNGDIEETTPHDVLQRFEIIKNRHTTCFTSSISDERGDELMYNHVPISQFVERGSLGKVIGHLWLKKDLPDYACRFIETVLILLADHGPAVSGATNTIISARAGKDLVSSLASGLLTIGPRFGGAIDDAAQWLFDAKKNGYDAQYVVTEHKKQKKFIQGIGHKIKSKYNPDQRCVIIASLATSFPETPYYNLAKEVESLTLEKKANLILNVDGAIASLLLDMMTANGFSLEEIEQYIQAGLFNGFFVLSRSIGFIGHYLDQKRLGEGLYRTNWDDILYL